MTNLDDEYWYQDDEAEIRSGEIRCAFLDSLTKLRLTQDYTITIPF